MFNLSGLVNNIVSSAFSNIMGGLIGDTTVDPAYCLFIRGHDGAINICAPLPETFASSIGSDYDMPFADGVANSLTNMSNRVGVGLDFDKVKLGMRMMGGSTSSQSMTMQIWQGTEPMNFSIPIQFLLNNDPYTDIIQPIQNLMTLTLPYVKDGEGLSNIGNTLNGAEGMLMSPGPKLRVKEGVTTATVAQRMVDQYSLGAVAVESVLSDPASAVRQAASETKSTLESLSGGDVESVANSVFGNSLFSLFDIWDNISLQIGNFMFFPSVVITDVSSDYGIKLDAISKKPIELSATVSFRTFVTPKANDIPSMIFSS